MFRIVVRVAITAIGSLSVGASSFGAEHSAHWSYKGATGPTHWATLEKEYETCTIGKFQSPIEIRDSFAINADLPAIRFDYKASPLKIIDNGHTIQINYTPGSFIEIGDRRFELVQFHFHRPSEETINGRISSMVVHLVHKNKDGNLAVIAVLLARGAPNLLMETLWNHIPAEREVEKSVDAVTINAQDFLPPNTGYYTFTGSLTTPPCSEGVTWFVLKHPRTISAKQIATFAKHYPMNARPPQALNGREVKSSQ